MDWLVLKDNVKHVRGKEEVVGYHKIQGGKMKPPEKLRFSRIETGTMIHELSIKMNEIIDYLEKLKEEEIK